VVWADVKCLFKFLPGLILIIEPKVTESGHIVRVGQPGPLGLLLAELGEKIYLRRRLLQSLVS